MRRLRVFDGVRASACDHNRSPAAHLRDAIRLRANRQCTARPFPPQAVIGPPFTAGNTSRPIRNRALFTGLLAARLERVRRPFG